MPQATCPVCGTQHNGSAITCPPSAEDRAKARERGWSQARSRCAKAYGNAKQRGTLDDLFARGRASCVPFDCAQCGKRCTPGKDVVAHATRFCSVPCKKRWHAINVEGKRVKVGPTCLVTTRPTTRAWTEGSCPECGEHFIGLSSRRFDGYCSDACKVRQKRRGRRARLAGARVDVVQLNRIADRDDWTCGICDEPIDPDLKVPHHFAATIDHVIPLARGGAHSLANVQLAHFICNATKRDLVGPQVPRGGTKAAI